MVVRILCLICLHIVYALCLATAGLRVSQASVYPCILLSGPTPTLAVNLTTVSHSRKCCNFSCNFLSHFMKLCPYFNWCSSYPLYAMRHIVHSRVYRVAPMLYVSRKCPDVVLTVIKRCCLIAVALAWLRPSPENEFVLGLSSTYSH